MVQTGAVMEINMPLDLSQQRKIFFPAVDHTYETKSADRAAPIASAEPRLEILVVEDNPVSRRIVEHLLHRLGHAVVTAISGPEALATWAAGSFDLILMDIQMPGMSGLEALAAIRNREGRMGGHIPILAMTAHDATGDRERFLLAGFDGYLPKPIRVPDLYAHLKKTNDSRRGWDYDALIEIAGGDRDLAREMVDLFLEELPQRMAGIGQALTLRESSVLEREAHSLKGSIGYFAAPAAFEAVNKLTEMARSNFLDNAADQVFHDLKRETARLAGSLTAWRKDGCRP